MAVFTLKHRDTRPILQVTLKNPAGGVHDLTGSSTYKLHVKIGTAVFTRDMVLVGLPTAGTLEYVWVAADWTTGSPVLPAVSAKKDKELEMEYEVTGGLSRLTFPNGGYDTLKIVGDLGQS